MAAPLVEYSRWICPDSLSGYRNMTWADSTHIYHIAGTGGGYGCRLYKIDPSTMTAVNSVNIDISFGQPSGITGNSTYIFVSLTYTSTWVIRISKSDLSISGTQWSSPYICSDMKLAADETYLYASGEYVWGPPAWARTYKVTISTMTTSTYYEYAASGRPTRCSDYHDGYIYTTWISGGYPNYQVNLVKINASTMAYSNQYQVSSGDQWAVGRFYYDPVDDLIYICLNKDLKKIDPSTMTVTGSTYSRPTHGMESCCVGGSTHEAFTVSGSYSGEITSFDITAMTVKYLATFHLYLDVVMFSGRLYAYMSTNSYGTGRDSIMAVQLGVEVVTDDPDMTKQFSNSVTLSGTLVETGYDEPVTVYIKSGWSSSCSNWTSPGMVVPEGGKRIVTVNPLDIYEFFGPGYTVYYRARAIGGVTGKEYLGAVKSFPFPTGLKPSASGFKRVSSLVRRWSPGQFTLEIGYGGLGGFGPLVGSTKPSQGVPTAPLPDPGTTPPSPTGPTIADYEAWLRATSISVILAIFGHFPTFQEWSAWYVTYGGGGGSY